MSTAATEVLMEPNNRPYVDPDTKPGDDGTEEWAETAPGAGDPVGPGPLADPAPATEGDRIVGGSPADELANDADAVDARNDDGDGA
jgi:hypothetical protein